MLYANIVLTVLVLLLLASGAVMWVLWRRLSDLIWDFIAPEAENKPSKLANVVQIFADMIGRGVAASFKGALMGMESGIKRAENAIQGEIVEQQALTNPMLGAVLESFPKLKKTLRRNPALLDMALGIMAKRNGASQSVGSGSGEPKFKL